MRHCLLERAILTATDLSEGFEGMISSLIIEIDKLGDGRGKQRENEAIPSAAAGGFNKRNR